MSKKEKLIARLLSRPKDFTYDEAKTLLCALALRRVLKEGSQGQELSLRDIKIQSCSINHIRQEN